MESENRKDLNVRVNLNKGKSMMHRGKWVWSLEYSCMEGKPHNEAITYLNLIKNGNKEHIK